jgi:hypothetical protein
MAELTDSQNQAIARLASKGFKDPRASKSTAAHSPILQSNQSATHTPLQNSAQNFEALAAGIYAKRTQVREARAGGR